MDKHLTNGYQLSEKELKTIMFWRNYSGTVIYLTVQNGEPESIQSSLDSLNNKIPISNASITTSESFIIDNWRKLKFCRLIILTKGAYPQLSERDSFYTFKTKEDIDTLFLKS